MKKKFRNKINLKEKNENVLTRMVGQVLNSYQFGYSIDRIVLSQDMYDEFKKLMYNQNSSLGKLEFINNQEYWFNVKIEIDEDEDEDNFSFDKVAVIANSRIPENYKSKIEINNENIFTSDKIYIEDINTSITDNFNFDLKVND
jgi:hypothetical protein